MVCLQRLVIGAHHLSDVCCGAVLGLQGADLILPSQGPLDQKRLP